MSHNIPFEIQIEIVKRFPVKSLFQFRSVSKSCKSLIDSPQFIADYNACESRLQHLISGYKVSSEPTYYICVVDDDDFPQNKFASTFPPLFEPHIELLFVGSSQGLLCFWGGCCHNMAYIWNPAIRKSIAIDVYISDLMVYSVLGFGVCPNTNDPMLLKINYGYKDRIPQKIEVLTLSSRVWRPPRGNLPRKTLGYANYKVVIDGFIYWLMITMRLIFSFDMTNEDFAEINLPRSIALATTTNYVSISKLRDSLVLLEYQAQKPAVCSVWMMEKGFPKSFTKLYTVTIPYRCDVRVEGFRKNGEVILEARSNACEKRSLLKVYEPSSELSKDFRINGEHGSFFLTSYPETLLLLDQPDNQHIKM